MTADIAEARPRPAMRRRLAGSARVRGFLARPLNGVILLALALLVWRFADPVLRWTVLDVRWNGTRAEDCTADGACWVFLRVHFGQFLFGFYPPGERWRVIVGIGAPLIAAAALLLPDWPGRRRFTAGLMLGGPFFALAMFYGGFAGLPIVATTLWGGLMVTIVVGVIGVVFSLPVGTILALGRQSNLPLLRTICAIYIEVWRGVPLLGVLFMATLLLPLTLPPDVVVSRFVAVMVGIVLYASAFVAEVVRGGLQGVALLQYEAADALGFTYWRRVQLIVLPQAYRKVLPGLVNAFISLFKSSTLVFIVGIFDLLGIVQNASRNPDWPGHFLEGYLFVAAFFWLICYPISRYSRGLERRLDRTGRTNAVLE